MGAIQTYDACISWHELSHGTYIRWRITVALGYIPLQWTSSISRVNPVLHSHSYVPSRLTHVWLHPPLLALHSSISETVKPQHYIFPYQNWVCTSQCYCKLSFLFHLKPLEKYINFLQMFVKICPLKWYDLCLLLNVSGHLCLILNVSGHLCLILDVSGHLCLILNVSGHLCLILNVSVHLCLILNVSGHLYLILDVTGHLCLILNVSGMYVSFSMSLGIYKNIAVKLSSLHGFQYDSHWPTFGDQYWITLKWVQTAILTRLSNLLLYVFCVGRLNTIYCLYLEF